MHCNPNPNIIKYVVVVVAVFFFFFLNEKKYNKSTRVQITKHLTNNIGEPTRQPKRISNHFSIKEKRDHKIK